MINMINNNAVYFHRYDFLIITRQTKTQEAQNIQKQAAFSNIAHTKTRLRQLLLLTVAFSRKDSSVTRRKKGRNLKLGQKHLQLVTISPLTLI
jgi:hypothetical protein